MLIRNIAYSRELDPIMHWAMANRKTILLEGSPLLPIDLPRSTDIDLLMSKLGYSRLSSPYSVLIYQKTYVDNSDIPVVDFNELLYCIKYVIDSFENSYPGSYSPNDFGIATDFLNTLNETQFQRLCDQGKLLSMDEIDGYQQGLLRKIVLNSVFGDTIQDLKITLALGNKINTGFFELNKDNYPSIRWRYSNKDNKQYSLNLPFRGYDKDAKISQFLAYFERGNLLINIDLLRLKQIINDTRSRYEIDDKLSHKKISIINYNSKIKEEIIYSLPRLFKLRLKSDIGTGKLTMNPQVLRLDPAKIGKGVLSILPHPIFKYLTSGLDQVESDDSEQDTVDRIIIKKFMNLTNICYSTLAFSLKSNNSNDLNNFNKMILLIHLMNKNVDILKNRRNYELLANFKDVKLYCSKFNNSTVINFLFITPGEKPTYNSEGRRGFDIRLGISGRRK